MCFCCLCPVGRTGYSSTGTAYGCLSVTRDESDLRTGTSEASKRRWCTRTDHNARGVAKVPKSMRQTAVEKISVVRIEHLHVVAHRNFDRAGNDDSGFFTLVNQHAGSCIRTRRVCFVQHLQRMQRRIANLAQRNTCSAFTQTDFLR